MAYAPPSVLELNVGGVHYATTRDTLLREPDSLPAAALRDPDHPRDARGRIFFDRDGALFRYVLDYLRDGDVVLPECVRENKRLAREAKYYRLVGLENAVRESDPRPPNRERGCITVGCRGRFEFSTSAVDTRYVQPPCQSIIDRYQSKNGRNQLRIIWRKLLPESRIFVSGKVTLCREVFGKTLNESLDPDDRLADRYTSRFFLEHLFVERAFDMLQANGFKLTASCGSGSTPMVEQEKLMNMSLSSDPKTHYHEFVFVRE